mmetsp:Transcript_11736/g.37575  ORF Transcript_11736/g.37575 Transcript_11736/m.37575 type:complete len:438 (-) Transcript_11736:144-1457(-)
MELGGDLGQRERVLQHRVLCREEGLGEELAAALLAERDEPADVLGRREDRDLDEGLVEADERVLELELRERLGRADLELRAVLERRAQRHRRRGEKHLHVVLLLQPLLDHLEVEQPEEAAAQALPERGRALRLDGDRAVLEEESRHGVLQRVEALALEGVHPGEDHRLRLLEARQRGLRRGGVGEGVSHARLLDVLHTESDARNLPRREGRQRHRPSRPHQLDLLDGVRLCRRGRDDLRPEGERAVEHLHQAEHAAVVVVPRVEEQETERRVAPAGRRRHAPQQRGEEGAAPLPCLRRDWQRVLLVKDGAHLRPRALDVGVGQVDLVDHRHNLDRLLKREPKVGHRLRLHALGRVDEQQRALAGGERARDLVREVDVAGRVDEVEQPALSLLVLVQQRDGLRLDRDAAAPLDRQRVERLRLSLARTRGARHLEHAVG